MLSFTFWHCLSGDGIGETKMKDQPGGGGGGALHGGQSERRRCFIERVFGHF